MFPPCLQYKGWRGRLSILCGMVCTNIIYCNCILCDNVTEDWLGGWYNKEKNERSYGYGYDEDR